MAIERSAINEAGALHEC